MMGTSHKAIGLCAGIATVALWPDTLNGVCIIAGGLGAMLPDIDHDNSRIGKKRKEISTALKFTVGIAVTLVLVAIVVAAAMQGAIYTAGVVALFYIIPIIVLTSLLRIPYLRKQLKFLTKHRGIMHTLVIPALGCLSMALVAEYNFLLSILVGLNAGYVSHLIADCLTIGGCPILYPLSQKPMHILGIRTNTWSEKVTTIVICGGLIWLSI